MFKRETLEKFGEIKASNSPVKKSIVPTELPKIQTEAPITHKPVAPVPMKPTPEAPAKDEIKHVMCGFTYGAHSLGPDLEVCCFGFWWGLAKSVADL